MYSFKQVALALVASAFSVQATHLTLNDYQPLKSAVNNPPACGVGYQHLDVNKITAIAGISGNHDSKCGSCIQVCGSAGCGSLLVVDGCAGSDHIDISTVAGPAVVGSDTGNHDVTYTFVDASNCGGIWDGEGMEAAFPDGGAPANWSKLKSGGGGSPSVGAAPSSAAAQDVEPAPTTVQQVATLAPPAPEVQQATSVQQQVVPSSTAQVAAPETPSPVVQPDPTPQAPAPSSFTTFTTQQEATPTPSPAFPAEFHEKSSAYESSSTVTIASHGTLILSVSTSSGETPVPALSVASVSVPTPSGGAFYEASALPPVTSSSTHSGPAASVAIGTETFVYPAGVTPSSRTTPTPAPSLPAFTGAASRNTAVPVIAGSFLAGLMALLFWTR